MCDGRRRSKNERSQDFPFFFSGSLTLGIWRVVCRPRQPRDSEKPRKRRTENRGEERGSGLQEIAFARLSSSGSKHQPKAFAWSAEGRPEVKLGNLQESEDFLVLMLDAPDAVRKLFDPPAAEFGRPRKWPPFRGRKGRVVRDFRSVALVRLSSSFWC